MKPKITFILAALTALVSKSSAALSFAPSADADETGALKPLKSALAECKTDAESVAAKVKELEDGFDAEVAAALAPAIQAKVAAGELVEKSIADAAVAAAETRGRDLAAAEFAKEKKEIEEVAARRQELAGKHGEKIAAALKDDALKGDAFAATSAELDRRIVTLKDHGVTLEKNADTVAQVACGHAFDDTGKAAFDSGISIMQSLSGNAPARKPGSGQPPAQGAAEKGAASKEEENKPSFTGAF